MTTNDIILIILDIYRESMLFILPVIALVGAVNYLIKILYKIVNGETKWN